MPPDILRESSVAANDVRLPELKTGEATIVKRYSEDRAVILHPKDYAQLVRDSRLVAALGEPNRLDAMTSLERKAEAMVTTPGAEAPLIEDHAALTAWLAGGE